MVLICDRFSIVAFTVTFTTVTCVRDVYGSMWLTQHCWFWSWWYVDVDLARTVAHISLCAWFSSFQHFSFIAHIFYTLTSLNRLVSQLSHFYQLTTIYFCRKSLNHKPQQTSAASALWVPTASEHLQVRDNLSWLVRFWWDRRVTRLLETQIASTGQDSAGKALAWFSSRQ